MPWTAAADTAPPDSSLPATVSSDPLPTAQIDSAGVVWTQAVVGNTVYAGGNFTKARPAGATAPPWCCYRSSACWPAPASPWP